MNGLNEIIKLNGVAFEKRKARNLARARELAQQKITERFAAVRGIPVRHR